MFFIPENIKRWIVWFDLFFLPKILVIFILICYVNFCIFISEKNNINIATGLILLISPLMLFSTFLTYQLTYFTIGSANIKYNPNTPGLNHIRLMSMYKNTVHNGHYIAQFYKSISYGMNNFNKHTANTYFIHLIKIKKGLKTTKDFTKRDADAKYAIETMANRIWCDQMCCQSSRLRFLHESISNGMYKTVEAYLKIYPQDALIPYILNSRNIHGRTPFTAEERATYFVCYDDGGIPVFQFAENMKQNKLYIKMIRTVCKFLPANRTKIASLSEFIFLKSCINAELYKPKLKRRKSLY